MPELLVSLDGQVVPIAKCVWIRYSACGCMTGVVVTEECPTEERCWKNWYPKSRYRDAARASGVRMELVTLERWKSELSARFLELCAACKAKREQALAACASERTAP